MATGNDANTRAQVIAGAGTVKWASIYRACRGATFGASDVSSEAAQAGDTVHITGGIYTADAQTESNFYLALSPINSGTDGNPIRFQSVDNERDAIRVTRRDTEVTGGSIIGSVGQDYIEWSGFDLNETDWPWDEDALPSSSDFESGKCLFYASSGILTGCKLENSKLAGTVTSTRQGDNYTLVRLHRVEDCTIKNVHFLNVGTNDDNNAGTLWYYASRVTVENCHFQDCGTGIYVKADAPTVVSTGGHIIRYNLFDGMLNTCVTFFRDAIGSEESPVLMYQNISNGSSDVAVKILSFQDSSDPTWVRIFNNVFYNVGPFAINTELADDANILFQNNILVNSGDEAFNNGGQNATTASLATTKFFANRNVYTASTASFADFESTLSYATWQGTYSQDPNSVTTSSTIFADAATGDFTLAGSSPAIDVGRVVHAIGGTNGDTIDAGAYITGDEVIGLTEAEDAATGSGSPIFALVCL